ncbi:MAG: hypothetical protein R2684_14695 [Pyrinomonadaceae bacterium]
MDKDGNVISNTNFHQVVVANGRFFDALTGADGVDSWEEYKKLWEPGTAETIFGTVENEEND